MRVEGGRFRGLEVSRSGIFRLNSCLRVSLQVYVELEDGSRLSECPPVDSDRHK